MALGAIQRPSSFEALRSLWALVPADLDSASQEAVGTPTAFAEAWSRHVARMAEGADARAAALEARLRETENLQERGAEPAELAESIARTLKEVRRASAAVRRSELLLLSELQDGLRSDDAKDVASTVIALWDARWALGEASQGGPADFDLGLAVLAIEPSALASPQCRALLRDWAVPVPSLASSMAEGADCFNPLVGAGPQHFDFNEPGIARCWRRYADACRQLANHTLAALTQVSSLLHPEQRFRLEEALDAVSFPMCFPDPGTQTRTSIALRRLLDGWEGGSPLDTRMVEEVRATMARYDMQYMAIQRQLRGLEQDFVDRVMRREGIVAEEHDRQRDRLIEERSQVNERFAAELQEMLAPDLLAALAKELVETRRRVPPCGRRADLTGREHASIAATVGQPQPSSTP